MYVNFNVFCRINNCVGEFNQKYFIMFLFYVGKSDIFLLSFLTMQIRIPCYIGNLDMYYEQNLCWHIRLWLVFQCESRTGLKFWFLKFSWEPVKQMSQSDSDTKLNLISLFCLFWFLVNHTTYCCDYSVDRIKLWQCRWYGLKLKSL